ncbi:MAG: TonB-dependent receptor [Luteolibacter sp.]
MKRIALFPLLLAGPAFAQTSENASHQLDELVVTASATQKTLFDLVQPATVVSGENLILRQNGTLGETLNGLPGVASTAFGPGASRPIIRGLGDDRVRILQNGTSVLDVSNVSPDHAVASDPANLQTVEVVRGPATLLYGPNAVGGVVNMIDDRIAEEAFDGKLPEGYVDARYGTVDDGKSVSGGVNWGVGSWVFHLDGFHREAGNTEIPGHAWSEEKRALEGDDGALGYIPNSFSDSQGAAAGVSYVWDKGFIGLSYSGLDSNYGTVAEEDVTIDLEQRRWDLRGAFREPTEWIKEIAFKGSYSDYQHIEFEGSEPGTVFETNGYNARVELKHEKIGGVEGAVGVERQDTEFSALGEEAFLPSVDNVTNSVFVFEELPWNNLTLQFGARYDRQTNETSEHDLSFDAFSTSGGIVYNPTKDYAVALSLGYSQRPPTYVELLADGPHVATGTYEIGDADLGKERSVSIDLSVRKKTGRVTGSAGAFYYRFQDYISLQPTGAEEDDLPVYAYEATAADFYGGELEATFHLLEPVGEEDRKQNRRVDLIWRADYVHAEDRDSGEPLPRIAPFRSSLALDTYWEKIGARLEGQWVAHQDRHAEDELPTDSYFLVNAGLTYDLVKGGTTTTFFLKGTNLLNQEARQSTSFLKDIAPLAGRGVVAGVRVAF